ncbi:MAG: hypothetical protein GY747_12405 [Planctomycetes bacterium]|nr:hypothetical protein [Planctomycetota bacterium]MCP4771795.1 hypothetical protein [Planctomycetota bacterium]MCP4860962.1 hypothetical protein [Planctomycetota bacterium]
MLLLAQHVLNKAWLTTKRVFTVAATDDLRSLLSLGIFRSDTKQALGKWIQELNAIIRANHPGRHTEVVHPGG